MIYIDKLTVRFGSFSLFEDISFLINPRDKIGLVGKNGAGKSTLLKLIVAEEAPDEGKVVMPSDIRLGYLPQNLKPSDGKTVMEETLTAFSEVQDLEMLIAKLNQEIADKTDYESDSYTKLLSRLAHATDRLHLLQANSIDAEAEQTLKGLGFTPSDFSRPTSEFSGGWRMRIELAKILLKKPDIFLLDEPTNHLDIESIEWLEDFLKNYPGALLLISHDKAFLDNVTKRTVEISLGKIYDYKAKYSQYVKLRAERHQQQLATQQNQQKMIKETERFIERFRYKATKAVQVQSRIKQLARLKRVEVDDEDKARIHFSFPPAPHSGIVSVETKNLTKKYGQLTVLEDINISIERGEKIAFVGKNGEGKTTLSRIIMGELEHTGEIKIGHQISIGYFAQNQDRTLDDNKTVFETLDDVAVGDVRRQVRNILGSFLFSGETIDKKVSVLSGGERSRLALAQLLLKPYSLLLLDEPTNHLDMRSKEILKQALIQYDGTLIVVSHDRDFLDGLVNKIFEFTNHQIKETIGGIYDFLRKKKMQNLKEIEKKQKAQKTVVKSTSSNKEQYEQRREKEKALRRIRNKIAKSEEKIELLEAKLLEIKTKLESPNSETVASLYADYQQVETELEKEMQVWEELSLLVG